MSTSKEQYLYNISLLISAFNVIEDIQTKPLAKLFARKIGSSVSLRQRVLHLFIEEKKWLTWNYILTKVKGNRAMIWATLCIFVNIGFIAQIGTGKRNSPYRYHIVSGITFKRLLSLEDKFQAIDKAIKTK